MGVAKRLVLDFYLIFEETFQLIVGLRCEVGNAITDLQTHLTNIRQFRIAGRR